jgi:threonine aldolase
MEIIDMLDALSQIFRILSTLKSRIYKTDTRCYNLNHIVDRLSEDHKRARRLAEALAEIPGIEINLGSIQTNIVWFNVKNFNLAADEFVSHLSERGESCFARTDERIRIVTHTEISGTYINIATRYLCKAD